MDAVQSLSKQRRIKMLWPLLEDKMQTLAFTHLNLLKSNSSQDKMCIPFWGGWYIMKLKNNNTKTDSHFLVAKLVSKYVIFLRPTDNNNLI